MKETSQLRKGMHTDFKRWENEGSFDESWNERTKIIGSLITWDARVIEFGAGNLALKNYLKTPFSYTPSDLYQHTPEHIICNLNERLEIELSPYNTAVFSGVLEYVYDIDQLFFYLANKIDNIVLSYACTDISGSNRIMNGWLSDYSREQLEEIFRKHKYIIEEYQEWEKQSIFVLRAQY